MTAYSAFRLFFTLICLVVFSGRLTGEEKKPILEVSYKPPKDAITTDTVEIVAGVSEVARLKVDSIQASRERTLIVPLKNLTDTDINIRTVSVSCGCMAAITADLVIPAKKTMSLYLKVTPEDPGLFSKRVTVSFEGGISVVVIVESKVQPAYSISPSRIALNPGSDKGMEIKITSNFGSEPFSVESPDALVTLRRVAFEGSVATFECSMIEEGVMSPWETEIPIFIRAGEKVHEYRLMVINASTVEIKPSLIVPHLSGGKLTARAVVTGFGINENPLNCEVVGAGNDVDVSITRRRDSGSMVAMYELSIEGDVSKLKTVELKWMREGSTKVLTSSQMVFRR